MKKIFSIAAIVSLIGVIALPVIASSTNPRIDIHKMKMHRDFSISYVYPGYENSLSTTDQCEELADLYMKFDQESMGLMDELLSKNREIHGVMTSGQRPDMNKVESIKSEISDIWTKLTQLSIDLQFEEQKINPDINY